MSGSSIAVEELDHVRGFERERVDMEHYVRKRVLNLFTSRFQCAFFSLFL